MTRQPAKALAQWLASPHLVHLPEFRGMIAMRRLIVLLACASALALQPSHAQAPRRPLRSSDLYRLRDVRDPQISPDGGSVAYTVTTIDSSKDKSDTDIWMVSWDGTQTI